MHQLAVFCATSWYIVYANHCWICCDVYD